MDPRHVIATARQIMRGPLIRARHDCLFDTAALSVALWGRDPLATCRPAYGDEAEALAQAEAAGGLLTAADRSFRAAGMARVSAGDAGDLALVSIPVSPLGATFAISIGRGWVTRGARGPVLFRGPALGVWSWV